MKAEAARSRRAWSCGLLAAHPGRALEPVVVSLFIAWAAVYLLWPLMQQSLGWRIRHDTPFLLYMAYIMDRWHYVPYRDFHDVNMLGSYLIYQAVGHFFGFTDEGVHRADILILLSIMGLTVLTLWRVGLCAACFTAVLFPLMYLGLGSQMTIQRDYLTLLPALLGTGIATGLPVLAPQWRALGAGVGFGMAAAIKPHAIIGLGAVVIYLAQEESADTPGWRPFCKALFWNGVQAGLGVLLPVLAYVGYLAYHGALGDFLDSAINYVPLYAAMNGSHRILTGHEKFLYTLDNALSFKEKWPMLCAALMGAGCGFALLRNNAPARRIAGLVLLMLPVYAFYPAITGQFWTYHYLPFHFWMAACTGLLFAKYSAPVPWQQRVLPMLMLLLIFTYEYRPQAGFAPLHIVGKTSPNKGRVEEIAKYLKENMQPGDTVQPLDWVGGGMLHAMLLADARPATRFLTYFDFFHHVDDPCIQNLRKRFMEELSAAKPRFILEWKHGNRGWVSGPGTADRFPEAERYVRYLYEPKKVGPEYIIHERRPIPGPLPLAQP